MPWSSTDIGHLFLLILLTGLKMSWNFKTILSHKNSNLIRPRRGGAGGRLSQSQATWAHCGQEICIESQEISVNIHMFVLPRRLDILTIFTREYRILTGNLEFCVDGDRK